MNSTGLVSFPGSTWTPCTLAVVPYGAWPLLLQMSLFVSSGNELQPIQRLPDVAGHEAGPTQEPGAAGTWEAAERGSVSSSQLLPSSGPSTGRSQTALDKHISSGKPIPAAFLPVHFNLGKKSTIYLAHHPREMGGWLWVPLCKSQSPPVPWWPRESVLSTLKIS